jgi:isopentenyl phosphate kinase
MNKPENQQIRNTHHAIRNLLFLKLGGSLITDKTQPHTPRPEVLARLAKEIATAFAEYPHVRLLLGHGSGSFGHVPAMKYNTRQGVHTPEQWHGFAEVWRDASALNRLVMEALHTTGLPVIAFPPSASVTAHDGQIVAWDLSPIKAALDAGLLPVVGGDVIFDTARGGTILSTEDLFVHLARQLHPQRILLAGIEPGVWVYPSLSPHSRPVSSRELDSAQGQEWGDKRGVIFHEITPANFPTVAPSLAGSIATDVTGGMASKVRQMLALVEELPGLEVLIFSGEQPRAVQEALLGVEMGTKIWASSTL